MAQLPEPERLEMAPIRLGSFSSLSEAHFGHSAGESNLGSNNSNSA
jgi:hypothetical protein